MPASPPELTTVRIGQALCSLKTLNPSFADTECQRPQLSSVWNLRNRQKRQHLKVSRELSQGNREMSNQLMETLSHLQDRDLAAWGACVERAAATSERVLGKMAAGLEAVVEQNSKDIRMLVEAVKSSQGMMGASWRGRLL